VCEMRLLVFSHKQQDSYYPLLLYKNYPSGYCVVVGVLTMSQNTVYFRWLVEKVRGLYLSFINKKVNLVNKVDKFKLFRKNSEDIIIIYIVDFFVALF
jgi:hypothetical protein